MTADLATWLRTQLDADEKAQREPYCSDGWHANKCELHAEPSAGEPWPDCDCGVPARILADIEARRRIIDAWLPPGENPHPGKPCTSDPDGDPDGEDFNTPWNSGPCVWHLDAMKRRYPHDLVLRLLALPYADRAGYDQGWRP